MRNYLMHSESRVPHLIWAHLFLGKLQFVDTDMTQFPVTERSLSVMFKCGYKMNRVMRKPDFLSIRKQRCRSAV